MIEMTSKLYSDEAEQSTIGGVAMSPESFEPVAAILGAKDFYRHDHRTIWTAMTDIQNRGEPWEFPILLDYLGKTGSSELIPYVAMLVKNTPSARNVTAYAGKVREYAKLRALYTAGMKIQSIAVDAGRTLKERVDAAHEELSTVAIVADNAGPRWMKDGMRAFVDHLDACNKASNGIIGIETGFDNFDKRLGGLQPGRLYVIAARPAMGKSVFGMNMARHASLGLGLGVLYFSLEMPEVELLGRLTADYCNIPYDKVTTADLDDDHWPRLTNIIGRSRDADLIIDETALLSISDIRARSKMVNRAKRLSLIVVDHLHLVEAEGENEVIKIGKVSSGLKQLAKELAVPVVALCQLNRSCDSRTDRRPMMSDLRQSGNIEQDADAIGFIYRDVVYNEQTTYPELCEVIWRKMRGGKTGTDYFQSQLGFCRFKSCDAPAEAVEIVPFQGKRRKQL
jgi:replicative DNA helicase